MLKDLFELIFKWMDALMKNDSPGKLNRIELRVYELLGIRLFRKAILVFEKIRHLRDGDRNENYHPKNTSLTTIESFSGYLIYNALFHIVSIALVIVYFAITISMQLRYLGIDIVMYIVVVFDLYCLMLQRYIHLKFKLHSIKVREKRDKQLQKAIKMIQPLLDEKDIVELQEEYELLMRFHESQLTGADCVLDSRSSESLKRLSVIAEQSQVVRTKIPTLHEIGTTFGERLLLLEPHLHSDAEKRVSNLQTLLGVDKSRNVSFGYSIITEDSNCEDSLCALFPDMSREKVEFTVLCLLTAYEQKGLVRR